MPVGLPTICLVIPPSLFLLDERVFINLGILKIAAVLEAAGYPLEVLDLSGIENFEEVAKLHFRLSKATICGITSTTPQMPQVFKIVQAISTERKDLKLILGGPHVTLVHTAYQKEVAAQVTGRATRTFNDLKNLFHVLVIGDGEEAVFNALEEHAPQVINANERKSPLFLTSQKYNLTPFPARHLVDIDSYHYSIEGHRAVSLIAQLGCPFACGFCGGRESPSLRVIRTRTTENILTEVEFLHRTYGFTGFMFYDDELNVNPKMLELMEGLIELQKKIKTEFRLRGFVKAELFTAAQAKAMYQAGFRWLLTGFESGAPRILENMNKKATREDNTRCVQIAKEHELKVKALMSLGHPGESKETIEQTRNWLLEVKPNDFDVTLITTYPGTPYYDQSVAHAHKPGIWVYTHPKNQDKLYSVEIDYNQVADYYKGDPNGGYRAYVYTDHLSSEELIALRNDVESDVRHQLKIPFNPGAPAVRYEHSMGQFGATLPSSILKTNSQSKVQESNFESTVHFPV